MSKTPRYIRNKKGQPIGVLAALSNDTHYAIGFSLCAISRGDEFDKVTGNEIAEGRALKTLYEEKFYNIPQSILKDYEQFKESCEHYFKNKEFKIVSTDQKEETEETEEMNVCEDVSTEDKLTEKDFKYRTFTTE